MRQKGFLVAAAATAVLALTGCSAGADASDNNGSADSAPQMATGIPAHWVEETSAEWPESSGYGSGAPMLGSDPCLLDGELPEIVGSQPRMTASGFGAYGETDEGYRYLCSFLGEDYAGEVQLMSGDERELIETVNEFRTTSSTSDQDNTVEEIASGELDMYVLTRWYPTNPQGMYIVLYHDEETDAIVTFEVNSLEEAPFEELGAQGAADAFHDYLAAAGE